MSSSALRLLQLAGAGDRAGCLAAIAQMQASELDEALPRPSGGDEVEVEGGVTFLLRAVELREQEVVEALLRAGASCAVRTTASAERPRGRDAWTEACAQGTDCLCVCVCVSG